MAMQLDSRQSSTSDQLGQPRSSPEPARGHGVASTGPRQESEAPAGHAGHGGCAGHPGTAGQGGDRELQNTSACPDQPMTAGRARTSAACMPRPLRGPPPTKRETP